MAQRKTATKVEKEVINRLAHAIVTAEIAEHVIDKRYPQHSKGFREHMRKANPQFHRLGDELQRAVTRVRKQLLKEFENDENWKDK